MLLLQKTLVTVVEYNLRGQLPIGLYPLGNKWMQGDITARGREIQRGAEVSPEGKLEVSISDVPQ